MLAMMLSMSSWASVLLSLWTPGMSGIHSLGRGRSDRNRSTSSIIALTEGKGEKPEETRTAH